MSNEISTEVKLNQVQLLQFERDEFQFMLEKARFLANSDFVPAQYRTFVTKKVKITKPGGRWEFEEQVTENQAAIGNCLIVLDLANRLRMSASMVMLGMDVIEGRIRPSGKFAIAAINSCGKFSKLEWLEEDLGEKTVEYVTFSWNGQEKIAHKASVKINDMGYTAFATDLKSGVLLKSPRVTLEIAVKEGWWSKNGSKWPTMTQLMGRRRAASWFADENCPEILMGMRTIEEEEDIRVIETSRDEVGTFIQNKDFQEINDPVQNLKDVITNKKIRKSKAVIDQKDEEIPVDAEYDEVDDASSNLAANGCIEEDEDIKFD